MANSHKSSYSTAYVAKRLGVSTPTVQRWVDSGQLRAWKTLGGHRRIDAESADRLFREQEGAASPGTPALAVVLVDDNPDDRDLLIALFEELLPGARITAVDNGYDGLLAIGENLPDVVVTDIVMPSMDGRELLRRLQAHPTVRPALLIVSSSSEMRELPAGVSFLPKPLDAAELDGILKAAALR